MGFDMTWLNAYLLSQRLLYYFALSWDAADFSMGWQGLSLLSFATYYTLDVIYDYAISALMMSEKMIIFFLRARRYIDASHGRRDG